MRPTRPSLLARPGCGGSRPPKSCRVTKSPQTHTRDSLCVRVNFPFCLSIYLCSSLFVCLLKFCLAKGWGNASRALFLALDPFQKGNHQFLYSGSKQKIPNNLVKSFWSKQRRFNVDLQSTQAEGALSCSFPPCPGRVSLLFRFIRTTLASGQPGTVLPGFPIAPFQGQGKHVPK